MTRGALIATLLSTLATLAGQPAPDADLPHALPRNGATRLMTNEWVTAWDVTWVPNESTGVHRHRFDYFGVELTDSTNELIEPDGRTRPLVLRRGLSWFLGKGATHAEIGRSSEPPRHAVMVDRSEVPAPTVENRAAHPALAPPAGIKPTADNARIRMWDRTWTPGADAPLEFYGRHVMLLVVDAGELWLRGAEGPAQVSVHPSGAALFLPGGQVRAIQATKTPVRAIVVELK